MSSLYRDILRTHSRRLEPIPTGETPILRQLSGIRAVLFDVYGTLFISGSGEVGTARQAACSGALAEALDAMEVPTAGSVDCGVDYLFEAIEASHAESRQAGIEYPEVDIVELWAEVLAELVRRGLIQPALGEAIDPKRLAVEYEVRANPCWPMPHLPECLETLHRKGLLLGIVSNAQFYTPELFEALLGERPEKWGFDAKLQYYSYQHGRAKPGPALYEMAAEALQTRQIAAGEVLYVGNDMLNDVFPACVVHFHTALFAGDARSLRCRDDEPRVKGISADIVLTDLRQLVECIII